MLLVWDGVLPGVAELFRRPGKDSDVRVALKMLVDGQEVDWHAYNLHTCANVAKVCVCRCPLHTYSYCARTSLRARVQCSLFSVRCSLFTSCMHCLALSAEPGGRRARARL